MIGKENITSPMDLSIIIVNWNTRELLKKCLASIYYNTTNLNFEVIVIDNGSKDQSVEMVQENFPQVKLIANQSNTGYVAANNLGLEQAQGDFILLLNPDTEILYQTLDKMVHYMTINPQVGISGCQLLNPNGTIQLSVRRLPKLSDQIIILTKLHNFWPKLISHYLALDFNYLKEQEVEQVMGAFMLIRQVMLQQIGPLDPQLWSWFEDVDYCQKAKIAGWQIRYTPTAQIIHHKGQSFVQHLAYSKQKIFIKSLLYYFKKYHGLFSYLILLPFAGLSLILSWLVQLFKIKKKNK